MEISGSMRIFKNKSQSGHEFYTTTISSKNQDGTWNNLSIVVQFPKDTQLEDGEHINVNKGFLTNYKSGEVLKPKAVVTEFERSVEKAQEIINNLVDDLPF